MRSPVSNAVRRAGRLSGQAPEVPENAELGGFGIAIVNEVAERRGPAKSGGQVVKGQPSITPSPARHTQA
jgi:hypothetical protein